MMTNLVQISDAGAEPVTLSEFKDWLKVETDAEDAKLSSLIVAAREWAEKYCSRAFKAGEVWRLTLDQFPLGSLRGDVYYGWAVSERFADPQAWLTQRTAAYGIAILRGASPAITSITYIDMAGTQQTLASNRYQLVQEADGNAVVYPVYGVGWPSTRGQIGAVVVNFTAGAAPEGVKIAIKMKAESWYAERDKQQKLSDAAERQLGPYRVLRIA